MKILEYKACFYCTKNVQSHQISGILYKKIGGTHGEDIRRI